ncbi:hypothetical protein FACS1894130_11800 [Spirochaetia bacterium]|nr:hypothetical protein FACS1894130_11800 [Spirochaetia bacterium]
MGMVSYTLETLPPVNREAMAAMKEEDIDCSDIPPLDTLALRPKSPVDRGMYWPVKVAVTCKLDADVVAWLKRGGRGIKSGSILFCAR